MTSEETRGRGCPKGRPLRAVGPQGPGTREFDDRSERADVGTAAAEAKADVSRSFLLRRLRTVPGTVHWPPRVRRSTVTVHPARLFMYARQPGDTRTSHLHASLSANLQQVQNLTDSHIFTFTSYERESARPLDLFAFSVAYSNLSRRKVCTRAPRAPPRGRQSCVRSRGATFHGGAGLHL